MKKFFFFLFLLSINVLFAEKQILCPIFVEDEIDEEEVVEYKGQKIFMCCGTCVKEWNKNPDYYAKVAQTMKSVPQIAKIDLTAVKLMPQRFCPLRNDRVVHPGSPSVNFKGKKIYFFKGSDIKRKWDRDPDGYFEKARKAGLLPQFDKK
tara:strand:- start:314 stop:763 length:450 start_codon:yes stop_codon:yes gene_type:complete